MWRIFKIYLTSLEDYVFNIRLLFLQLITFSVPHLFGLKCVSNLLDNIFAYSFKLLLQSKIKQNILHQMCSAQLKIISICVCLLPSLWLLTLTACRLIVKHSCQKIDDWVVSKSRKRISLFFAPRNFRIKMFTL